MNLPRLFVQDLFGRGFDSPRLHQNPKDFVPSLPRGKNDTNLSSDSATYFCYILLCADDLPFAQDGTRRDRAFRTKGQDWYIKNLANSVYATVHGCPRSRIARSRAFLGVDC